MKLFIRIVMGLVALAAGALSFQSLAHLGELCGYGSLSWAYPVTLDLGAAASCASWIHERNRQALGMTWAMLSVSVVLNGTLHYLQAEATAPSWMLVVLVAAVPPAVFGLVVHLAVGQSNGAPTGTQGFGETFTKEPVPDEALDPVVELLEQGVGRRRLAKELDITEHAARVLLAERNGHQL